MNASSYQPSSAPACEWSQIQVHPAAECGTQRVLSIRPGGAAQSLDEDVLNVLRPAGFAARGGGASAAGVRGCLLGRPLATAPDPGQEPNRVIQSLW